MPGDPSASTRSEPAGWRSIPVSFRVTYASAFVVSVAATIYFCLSMSGGMEMPGGWTMSMIWMRMPGDTWLESGAMFLVMWLAMMVAMMLPSALPMFVRFHTSMSTQGAGGVGVRTLLVAAGYFAVWLAVGSVIYIAGVLWAAAAMQSQGLSRATPALAGVVIILAGVLQFSRWKWAGLGHCRDPIACGATQEEGEQTNGWLHGLRQGMNCAVCCAGPMLVLLVVGAMNPLAMVGVAAVIALEKLVSQPQPVVYGAGGIALLAGAAMVVASLLH